MTSILMKEKQREICHRQKLKRQHKNRHRLDDVATRQGSQGMPRATKAGRGKEAPLELVEGVQPFLHRGFYFWPPDQ